MKRRLVFGGALTIAALALLSMRHGLVPAGRSDVQAAPIGLFGVSGFLTVSPAVPGAVALPAKPIYVPGVTVTLTNLLTGTVTGPVRTDLSGRYTFPPSEPGRYRVCST